MRRMNSMLLGHHGASGRTDCMYLSDGETGCGIVPGERQMDDARGNLQIVEIGQRRSLRRTRRADVARESGAVVVNLQRADAGSEVDDAGDAILRCEPLHQRMNAEPQIEIEDVRPYSMSRYRSPTARQLLPGFHLTGPV